MTAILRVLGPFGIAGAVLTLALSVLLVIQKGETRHWKKQSDQFEQLYRGEKLAHELTVANYRAGAEEARRKDAANKARVEAEQSAINERTAHDYEARIAAARAAASRLRGASQGNSSGAGTATVPGLPTSAVGPSQSSANGFPLDDRLVCTEQSIQLDELIKWNRHQHAVDVNGKP